MSISKILEDWSEYDNKKKKGIDSTLFACTEIWEVDYLVTKINKTYPSKNRQVIKESIEACCKTIKAPYPRKQFIECVLKRLEL